MFRCRNHKLILKVQSDASPMEQYLQPEHEGVGSDYWKRWYSRKKRATGTTKESPRSQTIRLKQNNGTKGTIKEN